MLERNTATYTDRIGRLLPTEFVGAYLTVTQTVRDSLDLRQPVLLLCLVVCLIVIPVYLSRVKGINNRSHQIVVALSFLVWAYALGDAFQPGSWLSYNLYHPILGTAALVIWGLVPLGLNIGSENEVTHNGN